MDLIRKIMMEYYGFYDDHNYYWLLYNNHFNSTTDTIHISAHVQFKQVF